MAANKLNRRACNTGEVRLHGQSISPGIGTGICCLEERMRGIPRHHIPNSSVEANQARLHDSLDIARHNLEQHVKEAHKLWDDDLSRILKAHEMMLQDQDFIRKVEIRIARELKNVHWAVSEEVDELVARLEAARDPYMQARAEDIRDLGHMIVEVLSEDDDSSRLNPVEGEPEIMITQNLYPSLAMKAQMRGVVGFATESPAVSSHAAILLKGLGIPVVGAVDGLYDSIRSGEEVLVDGVNGTVILRPTKSTKRRCEDLRKDLQHLPAPGTYRPILTETRDGIRIRLMANIENPNQVALALRGNIEGLCGRFRGHSVSHGLKRTGHCLGQEMPRRSREPTEEQRSSFLGGCADRSHGGGALRSDRHFRASQGGGFHKRWDKRSSAVFDGSRSRQSGSPTLLRPQQLCLSLAAAPYSLGSEQGRSTGRCNCVWRDGRQRTISTPAARGRISFV